MTRALVTAGLRRPLPEITDPARTLVLVPSPVELERITNAYGDARSDALVPFAVRPIPTDIQAEADRRVREGAPVPLPRDDPGHRSGRNTQSRRSCRSTLYHRVSVTILCV